MNSPQKLPGPRGVGWRPSTGVELLQENGSSLPIALPADSVAAPRLKSDKASSKRKASTQKSGFIGRVYGFQMRSDTDDLGPLQVWTFRVVRYDEFENRLSLPPVLVEMRGRAFDGFINENDKVHLTGAWREGQILRTESLYNLTTETTIRSRDPFAKWRWLTRTIMVLCLTGFLAVLALIAVGIVVAISK